jgi:hypothetical protein
MHGMRSFDDPALSVGACPYGELLSCTEPVGAKVSALRASILTPARSAYPLVPCIDFPATAEMRQAE